MGMMSKTKNMEKQKERKGRASLLLPVRKFLMLGLLHLCTSVSTKFPCNGFEVFCFSDCLFLLYNLSNNVLEWLNHYQKSNFRRKPYLS